MKAFSGLKVERASSREILPAGGYVARIMGCKEQEYTWGSVLVFSFDIAEGNYKDFFATDYKNNPSEDKRWRGTYRLNIPKDDGSEKDGWTKKTFGGAIWAIEDSNTGYHWDWNEGELKNKMVGVIFRNREWEMNGKTGWTTECCSLESIDNIRNNTYRTPKDRPLNNKVPASARPIESFTEVSDDDLPF